MQLYVFDLFVTLLLFFVVVLYGNTGLQNEKNALTAIYTPKII